MAVPAYADVESRDHLMVSESDEAPARRPSRAVRIAGVASAALLLCAPAVWFASSRSAAVEAASQDTTEFAAVSSQKNWSITLKERDHCSTAKDNCITTQCCKVSSHKCILEGPGKAKCSPSCKEGKPCTIISETMAFDVKEHKSMFCWAVYTQNTGSPKKSFEKELIAQQFAEKVSIFECDAYAVYSDVQADIAPGLKVTKLTDVDGDFHFAKRKHTGAWVNAGMFMQAWKAIGREGTYLNYDWTIKADPDAVFFPSKLRERIHLMPVPWNGAFLQNCEKVDFGFFGNLEVVSKTAFSILIANIDTCKHKTVANWKVGIKNGKYGPMGEDLFAQICMEKNGVAKLDAFDITKDGACPAKRPENMAKSKKWHADCATTNTPAIHPFKKPTEYFACMKAARDVH
jgi:hypothetical protein